MEGLLEGKMEGKIEGIQEGLEKGEKKKQVEIARNLKKMDLPTETIVRATGLSVEEIEQI